MTSYCMQVSPDGSSVAAKRMDLEFSFQRRSAGCDLFQKQFQLAASLVIL